MSERKLGVSFKETFSFVFYTTFEKYGSFGMVYVYMFFFLFKIFWFFFQQEFEFLFVKVPFLSTKVPCD